MKIKVPNLGDGVSSATVVGVLIAVGDQIEKEQTILELETDKAVAPLPASNGGVVEAINVQEGDLVKEGQTVVTLTGGSGSVEVEVPSQEKTPESAVQKSVQPTPVIPVTQAYQAREGVAAPTSPSIRRAAARFGVDLNRVQPTGRGGRIVEEDIRNYIHSVQAMAFQEKEESASVKSVVADKPAIDFSKWGPISRKPISSLRQKIGEKMSESWNTVPHVTQFDDADITQLMDFRKKYNPTYKKKAASLTLTVLALKATVNALKKHPIFNASIDEKTQEVVFKDYYHIGVAVDTESGLIVPVIQNVDKKNLLELTKELNQLAEKARQRKLSLENLQGGTFTISNLGGLGVSYFTPIVNTPEVAILALSRGKLTPIYHEKKLTPRLMLPLGLSYDHRIIDGAVAARFMRDLVEEFENFKESVIKESV